MLGKGILQTLFESGAIVLNPGCGGCAEGHAGLTGKGEVEISTETGISPESREKARSIWPRPRSWPRLHQGRDRRAGGCVTWRETVLQGKIWVLSDAAASSSRISTPTRYITTPIFTSPTSPRWGPSPSAISRAGRILPKKCGPGDIVDRRPEFRRRLVAAAGRGLLHRPQGRRHPRAFVFRDLFPQRREFRISGPPGYPEPRRIVEFAKESSGRARPSARHRYGRGAERQPSVSLRVRSDERASRRIFTRRETFSNMAKRWLKAGRARRAAAFRAGRADKDERPGHRHDDAERLSGRARERAPPGRDRGRVGHDPLLAAARVRSTSARRSRASTSETSTDSPSLPVPARSPESASD